MDIAKSITQQIDQFITDNASFIKEDWTNQLFEDFPFNWAAPTYPLFLYQVEYVVKFLMAHNYANAPLYHVIIELWEDPNQAQLFEHDKSKGDQIMTEFDPDQPQMTFEIDEHKISIVLI